MKTKILILTMLLFGLLARAGNEGAQATPGTPQQEVLAEYIVFQGFFSPPTHPSSYLYQIRIDGTVQITSSYMFSSTEPEIKVLKVFNETEIAHIIKLVNSIQPGQLIDPNPEFPGCQDGPLSRHFVNQLTGTIQISEYKACKNMIRENANEADAEMIKILTALKDLRD